MSTEPSADLLVVGAGLAGLSVAAQVASELRVRVLDRASAPGSEATAQNAGMVRLLSEDPVERAFALRTHQRLAEHDGPEAPSRVTGAVLALCHDPLHLHGAVAWVRARGVQGEELARPAETAPVLEGAPVQRAWWLPEARVADAHALAQGFLRTLRAGGGRFEGGRTVTGLRVEGGRCVGVDTDQGPVGAGRVLLATGAWSAGLAAAAGLERPLVPLRRTLLQSAPEPRSHPDHPWVWLDDVGLYVRPEGGGWLGSPCDEAVDFPAGAGSQGPVEEAQRALFAHKLERFLPALGGLRFATGWSGLRTFAPDRRPVLGADPELDGLWWATGLGGYGVSTCLAVGEAVGSWLLDGEAPWADRAAVAPGRRMLSRWVIHPEGWLDGGRLISRDGR